MSYSIQRRWITEHRGWEDWLSALVGVLIVLSPITADFEVGAAVTVSTGFVGVLITMFALIELMSVQRWEEFLELICGVWVVASPFVFQYSGMLSYVHFALGSGVIALALFELWQDRNRKFQ